MATSVWSRVAGISSITSRSQFITKAVVTLLASYVGTNQLPTESGTGGKVCIGCQLHTAIQRGVVGNW